MRKFEKFSVTIECTESWKPSGRSRNLRYCRSTARVEVKVPSVGAKEFPVAFRVTENCSVLRGGTEEGIMLSGGQFGPFTEEIRFHGGNFYKPVRIQHGALISTMFRDPVDEIGNVVDTWSYFYGRGKESLLEDKTDGAVVVGSNAREVTAAMNRNLKREYLVCDGVLWQKCGEPVYSWITFGLGHNHGGTSFRIVYVEGNGDFEWFAANERKNAVRKALNVAKSRGDTNDLESLRHPDERIEIVRRDMIGMVAKKRK